jgi:hypothetical protein
MTRSMQALVVVPLAALSLALAAPAFADDVCDPLDVTCVVTGTGGSGQDPVTDTVDTVTGTLKPVVDDAQGTVDHTLHGTVNPPGGGGGGTGGDQPGEHGTAGRPRGNGPHVVRPQQALSVGGRSAGPHPTGSPPDTSSIPVTVAKHPVFADGFAGAAAHVVAQSLGVVLALLAVAVGFVMVQDRLDRRDPKLALAPVQTEMMGFS